MRAVRVVLVQVGPIALTLAQSARSAVGAAGTRERTDNAADVVLIGDTTATPAPLRHSHPPVLYRGSGGNPQTRFRAIRPQGAALQPIRSPCTPYTVARLRCRGSGDRGHRNPARSSRSCPCHRTAYMVGSRDSLGRVHSRDLHRQANRYLRTAQASSFSDGAVVRRVCPHKPQRYLRKR